MKNGVSSELLLLDWVLMVIFPKILIVLSLNPQYKSLFLFSTDETFRLGYLKFYFVQNVLLNKSNWAR